MPQTFFAPLFGKHVYNSGGRYSEYHSGESESGACSGYRNNHPERGQTGGVAQNGRANNVSVKLLQYNNKYQNPQRMGGRYYQHHQCADDTADDRPE